jgi:hypothetical protein
MEGIRKWPSSQAADLFDTGIQKLIHRYDKWLNSVGDYVEKYLQYVRIFVYNTFFFVIICFVNSSLEVAFQTALIHSRRNTDASTFYMHLISLSCGTV